MTAKVLVQEQSSDIVRQRDTSSGGAERNRVI